jgi:hypothetical protein
VQRRQRRLTSSTDNYGKLKPTAKKTRKHDKKRKKTLKNPPKKEEMQKLQIKKGGNNGGCGVAGPGHARDNIWYDRGLCTHKVH